MDYIKKKLLYTEGGQIVTIDGKYLCTLSMTDRAEQLINDVGWDRENESWLAYRTRTKQERIIEEQKRIELAKDLVIAYNEKHNFS